MYFCEKYGRDGEVGVSDRFTTGYLTVMVKSDYALRLDDVAIQLDKYNFRSGEFAPPVNNFGIERFTRANRLTQ